MRATRYFLAALAAAYLLIPRPALREGLTFSQAVYDRNHRLLRLTLSRDEKYRQWLPLSSMANSLVEAALLEEDRHFRLHPGVNPVSLGRAFWRTYVRGDRRIGGSTITMQLARMRYGIVSRTLTGKLAQIARAIQLERHYSKDEILEAYLNMVPYGGNIEGVGAASLVYFGKPVDELTVLEALTLSVIPKSPVRRTLTAPQNAQADSRLLLTARERLFRRWILRRPQDSVHASILALPQSIRRRGDIPFLAPHLTEALVQDRPRDAVIHSTLDLSLQRLVERLIRGAIERKSQIGIRNAAALLVDTRTMEVKALVGSADYFNEKISGQVNGVRARRSPGSTLKPFIYGLAFDQGLAHPMSALKDSPASFNGYNPENFERDFVGPISVHDALIRSRNIPALQVALQLKAPSLHRFLEDAGIAGLGEESFYGPTLALGGAEVSMEELVRLYSMLANRGMMKPLRYRMEDARDPGRRLLTPEASYLILNILKDHPRPSQSFRDDWTRDALSVHWKTGTSYAFRDAWSVGIFGPYALAVWVGNFNGEGNPAFVGLSAAAPLFFDIVDGIKAQDTTLKDMTRPVPQGVAWVDVCAVSGQIPGPHCPHAKPSWFIPGTSPIRLCDIHRTVLFEAATGRRACGDGPGVKARTYEFWPSDLLKLFRQAGVPRRLPPPDNPDCPLDAKAGKGLAPQITSPDRAITYNLRAATVGKETIPLSAVSDADAREIYWFVNERFVGRARGGEPFFWMATPGRAIVRVVDDQGRSAARGIRVAVVP